MKMRTAHSIPEFYSLLHSVPSLSDKLGPAVSNALFMFLMKLRLGDSNESRRQAEEEPDTDTEECDEYGENVNDEEYLSMI